MEQILLMFKVCIRKSVSSRTNSVKFFFILLKNILSKNVARKKEIK